MVEEIQKKASQSKLLQESPIFEQAVESIRNDLYHKWTNSNINDKANREELFQLKLTLEILVSKLDSYIQIAEVANEQAEDINNKSYM